MSSVPVVCPADDILPSIWLKRLYVTYISVYNVYTLHSSELNGGAHTLCW